MYVSVSLLLMIAFCVTKKRLHLFEMIAVWMAVCSVGSLTSSFLMINLDWVEGAKSSQDAIVRIINFEFIVPLIVVWMLDLMQGVESRALRWAGYFAAAGFCLMSTWLLARNHVIRVIGLGWLGFVAKHTLSVCLALSALGLIRFLMRKDGVPHGPFSGSE